MSGTYIIAAGVSVITSVWICYELVKSAFRKANEGIEYQLKQQNRLLIKLLEKEGATYDDLYKVFTDTDEEFWKGLASSAPKPKLRSRIVNTEQQDEFENLKMG